MPFPIPKDATCKVVSIKQEKGHQPHSLPGIDRASFQNQERKKNVCCLQAAIFIYFIGHLTLLTVMKEEIVNEVKVPSIYMFSLF